MARQPRTLALGILCGALILAAGYSARAQFGQGGGTAPDLSGYVTSADLASAVAASQATVLAAMPQPLSAVPPGPSGAGVVGSGNTYVPGNAASKQTVQRTTVNSDISGIWSVTWSTSFVSSAPTVNPIPLNASATSPFVCNVTSRSATAASGKCWQTASAANGLLGITISLGATATPTSTPVMIIGAEPTQ